MNAFNKSMNKNIISKEVKYVIDKLKAHRSPDLYDIYNEMLKLANTKLIDYITIIFNKCQNKGFFQNH